METATVADVHEEDPTMSAHAQTRSVSPPPAPVVAPGPARSSPARAAGPPGCARAACVPSSHSYPP